MVDPFRITLNTLTLNVKSDKVYTRHGVPISVTGIAQVHLENGRTELEYSPFGLLVFVSPDILMKES